MSIARLMQQAAAGVPTGGGDVWTDPDLANASYDSVSFSVAGEETSPQGLFFKPDGTKAYVIGASGDDVNEYDLSTAWDVSSASYVQNFSVSSQQTTPRGVFFKPDGTKMYIVGSAGVDVSEYDLSSAWDVSTASYLQNFSLSGQDSIPQGLFFKPDGTKMYTVGSTNDNVYEYDLSSAWDVSSSSFIQSFDVSGQDSVPTDLFFSPNGTEMYVVGSNGDNIYEYSLTSAWDISTASFVQSFSVAAQEITPTALFFKSDGSKMYVIGASNDTIYQYSTVTPAAPSWTDPDLANASYDSVSFSVATEELTPEGLFFKPDGTKMYVAGDSGNDVGEYDLGTAWDISTASFLQRLSVSGQDTNPQGLFFKPDGFKLYVVGRSSDNVHEYNLSAAWDVSTASFLQSFSVATQETAPSGVFFKPDGTKMYIVGPNTDFINEYDLSAAWDISTASYAQNFSVNSQETNPSDLVFNPDGSKMYVVGKTGDDVNEYDLSTYWDISTASYLQNFSVASQDTNPSGVFFKSDGSKMYIVGTSNDTIYQYSTA